MAAQHQVKRPVTAREVAERFGVSPRTVRRVMAQPRAEWLSENAISRDKPWLDLGMSRSSWYAKGKPMQPASAQDESENQDNRPPAG